MLRDQPKSLITKYNFDSCFRSFYSFPNAHLEHTDNSRDICRLHIDKRRRHESVQIEQCFRGARLVQSINSSAVYFSDHSSNYYNFFN